MIIPKFDFSRRSSPIIQLYRNSLYKIGKCLRKYYLAFSTWLGLTPLERWKIGSTGWTVRICIKMMTSYKRHRLWLTSFLHKSEDFIKKLFSSRFIVDFVQLNNTVNTTSYYTVMLIVGFGLFKLHNWYLSTVFNCGNSIKLIKRDKKVIPLILNSGLIKLGIKKM